jgi:hypothetical protein
VPAARPSPTSPIPNVTALILTSTSARDLARPRNEYEARVVTILIAFSAGRAVSGFTLRPIHRVAQTPQLVGEKRDFARRPRPV